MQRISNNIYNTRKKTRKKRRSLSFAVAILLCVIAGIFCTYKIIDDNITIISSENILPSYQSATPFVNTVVPDEVPETNQLISNLPINSEYALLIDLESGAILFDKNGTEKMYPASMTKIMTAVVALEHIKDLNEKILLNEAIFQPIYDANAATAGFLPGESVRVIDLLSGLLLPSGAECAVGLAEYTAGSESSFVKLMNDKAQEIGMSGSNFTNTTGLHDGNHYSTAMDMALLFKYALENDTFYEIITRSRYSTPATNRHDGGITFYSTLFSNADSTEFDGGMILGGKTGFTGEAGQCLASFAVKDGNKYILVTSGAIGDNKTQKLHIDDAFTVYSAIGEKGYTR